MNLLQLLGLVLPRSRDKTLIQVAIDKIIHVPHLNDQIELVATEVHSATNSVDAIKVQAVSAGKVEKIAHFIQTDSMLPDAGPFSRQSLLAAIQQSYPKSTFGTWIYNVDITKKIPLSENLWFYRVIPGVISPLELYYLILFKADALTWTEVMISIRGGVNPKNWDHTNQHQDVKYTDVMPGDLIWDKSDNLYMGHSVGSVLGMGVGHDIQLIQLDASFQIDKFYSLCDFIARWSSGRWFVLLQKLLLHVKAEKIHELEFVHGTDRGRSKVQLETFEKSHISKKAMQALTDHDAARREFLHWLRDPLKDSDSWLFAIFKDQHLLLSSLEMILMFFVCSNIITKKSACSFFERRSHLGFDFKDATKMHDKLPPPLSFSVFGLFNKDDDKSVQPEDVMLMINEDHVLMLEENKIIDVSFKKARDHFKNMKFLSSVQIRKQLLVP